MRMTKAKAVKTHESNCVLVVTAQVALVHFLGPTCL